MFGTRNRPFGQLAWATALAAALMTGAAVRAEGQPASPLPLDGDPERGAVLAATCAGCHGIPGYRNAYPGYRVPKLGGQNADYLEVALQRYREGTRPHPTMQAQASALTDQDIADLAAYFSGHQGNDQTGISGAGDDDIAAGRAQSAACAACHGDGGIALAPMWPNLAGQHESYLEHALLQYKAGGRSDPVMSPLIAPLGDDDIRHLAAYYAAQAGLHTAVP